MSAQEINMQEIITTVALLNVELKNTISDVKEFRKELQDTRDDVIKLKANQDKAINWTPKALTTLVGGIISSMGVATAAVITALKWIT